uniref:Protein kinase domain-containing protein n=1 Tax=Plectus sambesii TaxID=2011161 RepID=A0A914W6V5_9BILA
IQRDAEWGKNYQSRRENGLITTSDLMWFALQIARGMLFLASMHVLHRDIAVRNVLLKLDLTLKVADFGLSRKLKEGEDEYYDMDKEAALPIRYIAPETLKSRRFSINSESWSFGVVIWELFTFAEKKPYSIEFDSCECKGQFCDILVELLSSGGRLSVPNICPQQIKSLLSRLWDSDPKRRPSFQDCKDVIKKELRQSCPNIERNFTNVTEYNDYLTNDCVREREDDINPYEYFLYDKDVYGFAPILERHDYEACCVNFEIEPTTLIINKAIGKGHFSDFHLGMMSSQTGEIPVAVKRPTFKTGSMDAVESEATLKRQRQALRVELSIFAHLQSSSAGGHENVLKLMGAITILKTDFCLLTEYCECGSMDRFLQAKWKNGDFEDELIFEENGNKEVWKIQRDAEWGKNYQSRRENGLITTSDLMWFALQIARGMHFLASMNVIHRDAALRNVLLKSDYTLKVSGFVLSRKLRESDKAYGIRKEETALPIRLMAPETLRSGRFAITSEFWSFGVVIWELFTFAEKPPYCIEFDKCEHNVPFHEFLMEHLSSGHRLSIPNICPQQM